jgi:hypothetical protein
MKKIYCISFFYFLGISCCFTIALKSQQPTQEWVARYESPTGISGISNKMALDKVGNCYVFGEILDINNDVILIKYNSEGDTVWTRKYQGPGNELPYGVIADSIGNCYITFSSGPDFGPYDIITIKYNPQGVQQWIKTYDNGGNDEPRDIAQDNSGNIYVNGISVNESIIIKYNSEGDTIWTRKYTEPGFRYPSLSIAVDRNNNVYILGGKINIAFGTQNLYTIKYDSNGIFKWEYSYTLNGIAVPKKIKVDLNFNVFITGSSVNSKMLTIKYDSSGIEQWQRIYDGPGSGGDRSNDMKIDNLGNIIVTGVSFGSGSGSDYVTVKYNTNGDSLWVKTYNGTGNGNDEAYSLDLDEFDNAYVTGRSMNTGVGWDYVTIKYTTNGFQDWVAIYNNKSANAFDIAYNLALDKNNNIFITGMSDRGGIIYDYVTIKFSQTVGIVSGADIAPVYFILHQNYPNPFNPSTTIKYQLYKKTKVELNIFDISGKLVKQLMNTEQQIGIYNIEYSADDVSSGIYFYTLKANNFKETKKMIVVK